MEWTGLNELREKYLTFFESKGHLRLPSFPLVPINDKSLFLINSGMAPMKKYFTGEISPPRERVTTCQKCIRTPDIENVGKTARHGTFFEMLGNFSFGDYFKDEAIAWAWELFTEVLKIPKDKIHISVYLEDDEAYDIWTKKIGIEESHMVRLGKADNFWEHGTGPCGPCSEIHIDRGEEKGCGSPDCGVDCECDRFVEVWNLVFSQFNSDGNGNYPELDNKNIDTGMGLERLACIMQGVDNLFEVDTMQKIMKHISDIAGVNYKDDALQDVSLRVITDHVRSTTFMIADGVIPSNEGRGYVLRRLLRRAARHGRLLGINKTFLVDVVSTVVEENKNAYPELAAKETYIKKMVKSEEENFAKTIDRGFELLGQMTADVKDGGVLSSEDAFKLYDTYGFPLDLTKEIIAEKNISVDEDGFKALMEEQRVRARNARATDDAFAGDGQDLSFLSETKSEFLGYEKLECIGKVLGILYEGEAITTAISPQHVTIITDKTTFYAESGGQVSDSGNIKGKNCLLEVTGVSKKGELILHSCIVKEGELNQGEDISLQVSSTARIATARNHTGAHLLQAALRKVLGDHVHQAGQLVSPERLRFDFSHFEAVTREQLDEIERLVNEVILSAEEVKRYECDINSAKEKGAMALFGEKYGDIVRVCEVSDFSIELCGGTHIENTSRIGLFKILSESSVAAGVRRIEAVTGVGVLKLVEQLNETLNGAANALKLTNSFELINRCSSIMAEIKEKNTLIDSLNQKQADTLVSDLIKSGKEKNGLFLASSTSKGLTSDNLKAIGEKFKEKMPNGVCLLSSFVDSKGLLICVCGADAVKKGASAGKIVAKAAAITGGKGGGRPDSAMAGIQDMTKLEQALATLESSIDELVK